MLNQVQQEQITRIATLFGNGAHICVPKDWAGEQIIVVKPQRKGLKERMLSLLSPYLDTITGIYLYGSHARGEQKEDSDIDLFVITSKKLKIKAPGFEILCLQQKEIKKAFTIEPVLMYSLLAEAKPFLNAQFLEELKQRYKPRKEVLREFFKDCQRIIKIQEEALASEKEEHLFSGAVIYSLVLRLRGIFIIRALLKGKRYTHKQFKTWIKSNVLHIDFNAIYEAYRSSKQEKKVKQQIKVQDVQLLLEFLKKELSRLEHG